jgi:hypothetical protein
MKKEIDKTSLDQIWEYSLKPTLIEYYFDNKELIRSYEDILKNDTSGEE